MLSGSLVLCRQVPKAGPAPPRTDVATVISDAQGRKRQQAYKTEIIGGVVVHTPIQVIRRKLWLLRWWEESVIFVWKGIVIVNFNKAVQHAAQPASLWRSDIFEAGGFVRWGENTDSYDETFQNDTEEPEGRDRKGNKPGVLRCSYCVKQGNVVSTQLVVANQRRG